MLSKLEIKIGLKLQAMRHGFHSEPNHKPGKYKSVTN